MATNKCACACVDPKGAIFEHFVSNVFGAGLTKYRHLTITIYFNVCQINKRHSIDVISY